MPNISKIKIVCFGGGTGLSSLLSGLKQNPFFEITAVVTMFDNGGSSGCLRDRFGILPPGDILRCLLALSEDEVAARKLLLKRIERPEVVRHTGGNLLLFALEKVYNDYLAAVDACGQILSIRGRVVPVSLTPSSLGAVFEDDSEAHGETSVDAAIAQGRKVAKLFLTPEIMATQAALQAIDAAELVCVGPGSLFTSIFPNFLPRGVAEALQNSNKPLIYIANLLSEGPSEDRTLSSQVALAEKYLGRKINVVIANNKIPDEQALAKYRAAHKTPIVIDEVPGVKILNADLWQTPEIARHDSARLAYLLHSAASMRVTPAPELSAEAREAKAKPGSSDLAPNQ
ncbi:MAG: gluconeogenesis factor YvcK family protein [bacterium]